MASDLKFAAQNGEIATLQSISKADATADLGSNRTLLHVAADYGQDAIIKLLLEEKGAQVNARDDNGFTPLANAVLEGHTKCVKLLLEKGADKTVKLDSGESLLEVAETVAIKDLLK